MVYQINTILLYPLILILISISYPYLKILKKIINIIISVKIILTTIINLYKIKQMTIHNKGDVNLNKAIVFIKELLQERPVEQVDFLYNYKNINKIKTINLFNIKK